MAGSDWEEDRCDMNDRVFGVVIDYKQVVETVSSGPKPMGR